MTNTAPPMPLTPDDVERAGKRDAKHYELVHGALKAKAVGTEALLIATQICNRFNETYDVQDGFAVPGAVLYCFGRPDHGRKPSAVFVWRHRLPDGKIPRGELTIAPDVVVEVLTPASTAMDLEERLSDYLSAGVPLVWIVHPEMKTIRVYRGGGTTRLFTASEMIADEPLLAGFTLPVREIFQR